MNLKHQAFADEYLNNGRNATRAYMTVYKPQKVSGAEASSARLLGNAKVQAYIAKVTTENRKSKEISKEKYLKFLDSIVDNADIETKGVVLESIKIIGKWQGYESPSQLKIISVKDVLATQEDEGIIDL